MHFPSGAGMDKSQFSRMEALAVDKGGVAFSKVGIVSAVHGVSQQRVASRSHMHTDLMGASRLQLALHKSEGLPPFAPHGETLQNCIMGHGLTDRGRP